MPGLKQMFKNKKSKSVSKSKPNIISVFLQNQKLRKSVNENFIYNCSQKRLSQFNQLFSCSIMSIQNLRKLSWNGIPVQYRSRAWKILLKYTSTNKQNQEYFLKTKRNDYFQMVQSYIDNPNVEHDTQQKKIFKLIRDDVVRTLPESQLFRQKQVQNMLQRILYVWHMRHPSSGYVQGLNDIVTPFIIVFLSDFIRIDFQKVRALQQNISMKEQQLKTVEADAYWCFTKLLNQILDNYMNSWPGIQKSFHQIKEVINRVDPQLSNHFIAKGIDFYHIYFKWVTCLLLRQFSAKTGLRLFDTYFSAERDFFSFCQYIIPAVFLKYSKKLKQMSFEELMIFQQKIPTKTWDEEQLSTIIAQAYVYQKFFQKDSRY